MIALIRLALNSVLRNDIAADRWNCDLFYRKSCFVIVLIHSCKCASVKSTYAFYKQYWLACVNIACDILTLTMYIVIFWFFHGVSEWRGRWMFRIGTVTCWSVCAEGLWRMCRHGPVIVQCTDSVVFPVGCCSWRERGESAAAVRLGRL